MVNFRACRTILFRHGTYSLITAADYIITGGVYIISGGDYIISDENYKIGTQGMDFISWEKKLSIREKRIISPEMSRTIAFSFVFSRRF